MGDKIDYQYFLPHEQGKKHLIGSTQVTVYQALFEDDSRDEAHDYLYIGKFLPDFYIRTSDFDTRLKKNTLKADFNKSQTGKIDFFHVWKSNGSWFPTPTSFMHRVSRGMIFSKWSYNQKRLWGRIMDSAEVATRPIPYNPVMGRFLQLPASVSFDQFVVSPTASADYLSLAELEAVVAALPAPRPRVLSYRDAEADGSLCHVGSAFLGVYETWTSSTTYATVCEEQDVDPLNRPWPMSGTMAADIAQLFVDPNDPSPGPEEAEVTARVTAEKIYGAQGRRRQARSQAAVMNGVSATEVANKLWGSPGHDMVDTAEARTLDLSWYDVTDIISQWLHRVAFRFGGLGDDINPFSSQNKCNLVFGTKECNTHMLRAENAITKFILKCPDASSGLLITENILVGTVDHMQADGSVVVDTIPGWFKKAWDDTPGTMWWLSMRLNYAFNIDLNPQHINLTINARVDFDPFSRYRPLLKEVELDELVLDVVLNKFGLLTGPAPAPTLASPQKKASTMALAMIDPQTARKLDSARDIYLSAYLNQSFSLSDHGTLPPAQRQGAASSRRAARYSSQVPASQIPLDDSGFNLPGLTLVSPAVPPIGTDPEQGFIPESILLSGVTIRSPKIVLHQGDSPSSSPPTSLRVKIASAAHDEAQPLPLLITGAEPPPNGFTLEGEIDLFGIPTLTAKFYTWHGPVPRDSKVENPLYEMAIVPGDFKLSSVLDVLKGTPFDALTFRDATFMRQDIVFDATKAPGWHVDVDLPINSDAGLLYDVLHTMLGIQEPTIHLHAGLGLSHGWNDTLTVHSFTLEGSLPGIAVNICDGLTLSSIGVQIMGVRRVIPGGVKPKTSMEYGFGVFGSFSLTVPGALVPLELDFQMQKIGDVLRLAAVLKTETWDSPFGITGLKLSEVSFESDLVASSPMKTFSFSVSAVFEYGVTTAFFSGSYAAGGHFSLSAAVSNFDIITISDIFESLTGESLDLPDIDFKVGSATVTVASGAGLLIALTDVEVEGHIAANAVLSVNSRGAMVRGDVTSADGITFGEVELKKAYIQIDLRKGMEDSGVMLGGEISFASLTIDALVHLYRGTDQSMQWTAFASLTTDTQVLAISKIVPVLRDTFLDLALTKVVFVAASQDDPLDSDLVAGGYRIHKGVQVCAVLSPIKELDSLLRSNTPTTGLVLSAGWSKQTGFELEVLMPTDSIVNFGNGVTTDPFALRIMFGGSEPTLQLSAGVNIPTPPDGDKLKFSLTLDINLVGASATAQMHGNWRDPLGLGKKVVIGPDVALSIGIIFAQFVSTGTISQFGVAGGLAIGTASAQVAMQVSEDPKQEILVGEVKNLDLNDIVSFANVITGLDIPSPDMIDFQDMSLYICPFGTMIGTIVYPQGFSFKTTMILLSKKFDAALAVDSRCIIGKGGVDNFVLGPLSVRGTDGPRATVDIFVDAREQHVFIDGVVSFLDASVAVDIRISILPRLDLHFYMDLKFTDQFTFTLSAGLDGYLASYTSIEGADFNLDAMLQQDILDYVRDRVDAQFDIFRKSAEQGFDDAKKALQDEEDLATRQIDAAKEKLKEARDAWNRKYHEVVDAAQKIVDEYLKDISDLEQDIAYAQNAYDNAIRDAENAVQKANNDREAALRDARTALEIAKNTATAMINSAIDALNVVQDFLNRNFGYAVRDIEAAQEKVDGLQSDIDACQAHINWCNGRPWWDIPAHAAVVGYYAELAGLEVAKDLAWDLLEAAKAVVQGVEYLAASGAVELAKEALAAARKAAQDLIDAAQAGLTAADEESKEALDAAEAALEAVRYGVEYGALEAAKEALEAYKNANEAAFDAARDAIDMVEDCAEYAAFEAAQAMLDAAKAAAKTAIEGLKKALELAQQLEDVALEVGQWLADQALELVDIERMELSGTLRGMVGMSGKGGPFSVDVRYILMGKAGSFHGTIDLSDIVSFIVSLFNQMLKEVEGKLLGSDPDSQSDHSFSDIFDSSPTWGSRDSIPVRSKPWRFNPPPSSTTSQRAFHNRSRISKPSTGPVVRTLGRKKSSTPHPDPFRTMFGRHDNI
ncbi:uncharacterized protein BXZ73DRAFT_100684 [Epithele typhae]|uniref:uncharacterized protein n=1 Tax=Epithele typhae TaxID=378194 RepID=UPI002008C661|nr:uncharacterized protein BXZ73DRAFT_100684 [Epithele typhae]KAH9934494.1 hypothetical protein BXZ73DRAFT_100684 [Epithele typhae]